MNVPSASTTPDPEGSSVQFEFDGGRDLYTSKEQRAIRLMAIQLQSSTSPNQIKHPIRKRRIIAPSMKDTSIQNPNELCLLPDRIISPPAATIPTSSKPPQSVANASVANWIATRKQQYADVTQMGISLDWLDNKKMSPAETKYRKGLVARSMKSKPGLASAPSPSPSSSSSTSSTSVPETLPRRLTSSYTVADSTHMHAHPVSTSPTFNVSTNASNDSLGLDDATNHFRNFVRVNRWRLHDLFSRCGLTGNYLLTPEQICGLIEPVGGLSAISFTIRHSVAYERALESEGTLKPITCEQLLEIVRTFGVDRNGLIDFRAILDDYNAQRHRKQLQRLDKSRRRRYTAGWALDSTGGPLPSVHQCIAESIAKYHDPIKWLEIVGEQERQRETRIENLIAKSQSRPRRSSLPESVTKPTPSESFEGGRWKYLGGNTIPEREPIYWGAKLQLDGTHALPPPTTFIDSEATMKLQTRASLHKLKCATDCKRGAAEEINFEDGVDQQQQRQQQQHQQQRQPQQHQQRHHHQQQQPHHQQQQHAKATATDNSDLITTKHRLHDLKLDECAMLSRQLSESGWSFSPDKLRRAMVSPSEDKKHD